MSGKSKLAENTLFLYLLTFSNYIFGFITVPYQTRILGPDIFGVVSFALAFYTYFIIIIDFGFILSATKSVAEHKDDKFYIGRVLSDVTLAKICLGLLSGIILFIISSLIPKINIHIDIIILYLFLAILTSLTPDFIYRGLENMKMITIRTVVVRLVFTILIFIFLKKPSQYLMIPAFQIAGVAVSLLLIYYDLIKNEHIGFQQTSSLRIYHALRESCQYFVSRVASTIYGATNILIVGLIYPTSSMVGYYASAEKFKALASQGAAPIADSLYPYMIRTSDYRTLFRITAFLEVIIIILCILLAFYAEPVCVFVFGREYAYAAKILRLFIPILAIVLPNYVFGFPALTPIGQQKWANYSVEIAMINQIVGLFILYSVGKLDVWSICVLTILSDYICLIVRVACFYKTIKYKG